MRIATKEGILKGVKASKSDPQVTHLLFADDCILFGETSRKWALTFNEILSEYKRCSGHCVNFAKSTVFFSKNTLEEERQLVVNLLRVRSSDEPERYLGLPNMVGRKKKQSFWALKDRLKQRIKNWSIQFLSQCGKNVFIKAVLQAIPTYSMACFLLPKPLCEEMEGIVAKYWWQKGRGKGGIHWCSWKNLCFLKENGGWVFEILANLILRC